MCVLSRFLNATATTEIYTLSLHDALPISPPGVSGRLAAVRGRGGARARVHPRPGGKMLRARRILPPGRGDRKSTRLNSSHMSISYAVFCLKKKKYIFQTRPYLTSLSLLGY